MKRVHGWEKILDREIRYEYDQPFQWGSRDCCIWPCNVVYTYTGVDLAEDLRDKYHDALTAAIAMDEFANGGIEAMIMKVRDKFDVLEIPPLHASRGDLVMVRAQGIDGGPAHQIEFLKDGSITALAVVELDARYAATFAPEGLIHVPHEYWVRGFRI